MADESAESLAIAPSTDVGSEPLAAALAAMDIPGIARALRHDYIIVPLMRGPEGETQTRVLEAPDPEGDRRWSLCLFSSTQAFSDFVRGTPEREFAIRTGASLVPFLTQYEGLLRRIEFDPAGPHPVRASVADVLAALQPDASDDPVAWITSPEASHSVGTAPQYGIRPGERIVGMDLALDEGWAVVDLTDPKAMSKDIAALVKEQLRGLPRAPVLRGELTSWLTTTGKRAAAGGGRFMAYLTRRTETAAAAVSVVQYWQQLGPGGGHLDDVAHRLGEGLGDAELARAETPAGPFLRHTHRTMGPPELGGIPVFVIDYWLEFPDGRGICLLSFSTPHGDALDAIRLLTDNVVLASSWELAPGDPPPTH